MVRRDTMSDAAIMVGYPFGPFSDMEVYALADLKGTLQRSKAAAQAFAGG